MILVDNKGSTNPYINLAVEEFMVRNADCGDADFLYLYINEPCIVVGKNQSIYKEVNFDFLRNGGLKLARRISGGGTVYQDEGNLNFSFISKFADEKINNYKHFNQPVVEALRKMGVNALMDNRNNILVEGKKISGNAQFTNRKNILSHGTLLFNADLATLRACLKPNLFRIETKAVASVPSAIMNISEVSDKFSSASDFRNYMAEELGNGMTHSFTDHEWSLIQVEANQKFAGIEWVYGRSPRTVIYKDGIEIEVENGVMTEVQSLHPELKKLVGIPYEFKSIKKTLEHSPNVFQMLSLIF